MQNKFLSIFVNSFRVFLKNPVLVIPTLTLFLLLTNFSKLSVSINYNLTTTPTITAWLVFFSLISLLIMSFLFSSLIGMCKEAINKKAKLKHFFIYGKLFFLKNLIIMIVILAIYNVIRFLAHYGALGIGKTLNLPIDVAQLVFFIIFAVGLVGILIFMTYASFYLIISNLTIKQSIKSSARLVKARYPATLTILLIFFIINQSLSLLNNQPIFDFVNVLFLIPYLAIILSLFVISNNNS